MGTVTKFHVNDTTLCHWLSGYQSPHLVTQCHIPEDVSPRQPLCQNLVSHTFHAV